jgi:hypothetical protein
MAISPDPVQDVDRCADLVQQCITLLHAGVPVREVTEIMTGLSTRLHTNATMAREMGWTMPATEASTLALPIHRTEAQTVLCATCDGGGCLDCTDPA